VTRGFRGSSTLLRRRTGSIEAQQHLQHHPGSARKRGIVLALATLDELLAVVRGEIEAFTIRTHVMPQTVFGQPMRGLQQ